VRTRKSRRYMGSPLSFESLTRKRQIVHLPVPTCWVPQARVSGVTGNSRNPGTNVRVYTSGLPEPKPRFMPASRFNASKLAFSCSNYLGEEVCRGTTMSRIISSLILAALTCGIFSIARADSQVRIVRLSDVQGDVKIDRDAGEGYQKAFLNMPITKGT